MDDDDLYTTAGVFPASRKAMTISNKAMDEGDLRTSASSRKDQQLLSDITAKLVSEISYDITSYQAHRLVVFVCLMASHIARNIWRYVWTGGDTAKT